MNWTISSPVECYYCKQIKSSCYSTNITKDAAGSAPSIFKPVCEDCAATIKIVERDPDTGKRILPSGDLCPCSSCRCATTSHKAD